MSARAAPAPAARIGARQLAGWRLARHGLDARAPAGEAIAAAARICGLHAQLTSSADLSLRARVGGLGPDALADLLWERRELVKTWAMRGTLHLLPTAELGLWLSAQGTRDHYLKPSWSRAFGVSPTQLDTLTEAVCEALDGPPLTREELADAVARITGSARLGDGLRGSWGAILKPVAFRGRLVFGPDRGRNVTFTRPDRWVGAGPDLDPAQALREVARRFLAAYAPATREDLARWWAMSPAAAGRLLKGLGEEVAGVAVEGLDAPAFALAEDLPALVVAEPPAGVRLLPAFDPYVVGATLHSDLLSPAGVRDRIYRAQGWLSPVLLVDGRMEGVWRHERRGARLELAVEPFAPLSARVLAALEREAGELAAALGGELDLIVSEP